MDILYLFAVILFIIFIGVMVIDWHIHNYRYKAGRRYRKVYLRFKNGYLELWVPDKK